MMAGFSKDEVLEQARYTEKGKGGQSLGDNEIITIS
jgi:hypothetical protein